MRPIATITLAAILGLIPSISIASVKSLSTDGEATIYLQDDFSRTFDIAYNVAFDPAPANKSWSSVSINLLGIGPVRGAIAVGLSRGYPTAKDLRAFILSNDPGKSPKYQSFTVQCDKNCIVELSANGSGFYASANGQLLGTWSRTSMTIPKPYVQVNGEVSVIGDTISARFLPMRLVANGHRIASPYCAFTTQGVEARAIGHDGLLEFDGARRPSARVTYVSLLNGRTGDSCTRLKGAGEKEKP